MALVPMEFDQTSGKCFMADGQHNFGQLVTSSVGDNVNTIVDNLVDNNPSLIVGGWLYFSFIAYGGINTPSMGANYSWWYGMINSTKNYGWIRGESFDQTVRGKRKGASTFTF